MNRTGPLLIAHVGDLHIAHPKQQNYVDLLSIVAQLETECGSALDFVVLPVDNADNGLPIQYKWVATALKMISVPVCCIPGDHDMEQKSLAGFYQQLQADSLPIARVIRGVCCLFLDISGPGTDQRSWSSTIYVPPDDQLELTVEAIDGSGRPGRHTIQLAQPGQRRNERVKNGSDADSIGTWPENGLFGTQLGPNRNGKPTS